MHTTTGKLAMGQRFRCEESVRDAYAGVSVWGGGLATKDLGGCPAQESDTIVAKRLVRRVGKTIEMRVPGSVHAPR